jgi:copper chaperone
MATYQFQTSLNCANCVNRVRPFIDELSGIENWSVDTADSKKILTVSSDNPDIVAQVVEAVEEVGFDITPIAAK